MSKDEIIALVRAWLSDSLDAADRQFMQPEFAREFALHAGLPLQAAAAHLIGNDAEAEMERWRGRLQAHDWSAAEHLAQAVIKTAKLQIEPGSTEHRELCMQLTRAAAELHGARLERSLGNFGYNPLGPSGAFPPPDPSASTRPRGRPLGDVIAEYLEFKERIEKPVARRLTELRGALALAEEWFGKETPIDAITKECVGKLRTALSKAPPNYRKVYPRLTLVQVLDQMKGGPGPTLSFETINGYLGVASGFFDWCVSGGLIKENPAANVRVPRPSGTDERKRSVYTAADLDTMFNSPLYVGCRDESHVFEPGTARVRNWKYWVPLIGLYTGARLGEICQLRPQDVREVDGVWCFAISREGKRSVKTKAGERLVPLHPELLRLRVPGLAKERARASSQTLLPDMPAPVAGYASHYPSRWFSEFLDQVLGESERKERMLVFHGFRHTMKDAMREAEIDERVQDRLIGHAAYRHVSQLYGEGYKPPALFNAMSRVKLPVNLDHLVEEVSIDLPADH